MRNHGTPVRLPALLLALTLAGCAGQGSQPTAPTPPPASAPAAAADPTPDPYPPLHLLGDSNGTGWYSRGFSIDEGDAQWVQCIRFDEAREIIVGEPLTSEESGYNLLPLVDEENVYGVIPGGFGGPPRIYRTDPTGTAWEQSWTLPEEIALSVWHTTVASDGEALYLCYWVISDDPSRQDDAQIGRFDLATGELTPVTDWDGYFRGTLCGVWQAENKLLFTRRSVAADCPYEPVISQYTISNWDQLDPWVSTTLYALDPHTGEETALLTEKGQLFPWRVQDDRLYQLDSETHTLCSRALDSGETETLPMPAQALQIAAIYPDLVLLEGYNEQNVRTLYLCDRATGETRASPLYRMGKDETTCARILCETGAGEYLIVRDSPLAPQQRTGMTPGERYTVWVNENAYELVTREALLDAAIPGRPVLLRDDHID